MEKVIHKVIIFLLLFVNYLPAAFEIQLINPENIACGSIVSILPGGLNYSTILDEYGINLRASYTSLFGINELAYKSACFSWNHNMQNGYSLRLNAFGDEVYNESQVSAGYARKINPQIRVSVNLNIYNLSIKNYYKAWCFGAGVGGIFNLTEKLKMSLLYNNINGAKLKNGEPLPRLFCAGFKWELHQKVDLMGEFYKDTEYPFITRMGTKIKVVKHINGMAGVQFEPNRFSYGVCCYWGGIKINVAYKSHFDLPSTLYFGCHISIK